MTTEARIDAATKEWLSGNAERGDRTLLVFAGMLGSRQLAAHSLSLDLLHIVAPESADSFYTLEDQHKAQAAAEAALERFGVFG